MKFKSTACLALLTLGLSAGVSAECTYPKIPADTPNGATATETELVAAVTDLKRFDKEINSYAACIDQAASAQIAAGGTVLSGDEIKRIKTESAKKHNDSVDDLQKRAAELNAQIKVFKARTPK
jgi:hypothetical protein